jgi:hypothetical protein
MIRTRGDGPDLGTEVCLVPSVADGSHAEDLARKIGGFLGGTL